MPRDRPRTAHSQTETEEKSQNKFGMPELFDAVLNRQPGITLGISGPHLGHLFCRVSAKRCRRQHTHEGNDSDGGQSRANKCAFDCSHNAFIVDCRPKATPSMFITVCG